jgi:hypothetical protein
VDDNTSIKVSPALAFFIYSIYSQRHEDERMREAGVAIGLRELLEGCSGMTCRAKNQESIGAMTSIISFSSGPVSLQDFS